MLTYPLIKVPTKPLIISALALALLCGGGFAARRWVQKRDAAHQALLIKQTQDSLDKINVLQGKIDQLGTVVADREQKLAVANTKLQAALKKPLPPLPPAPTQGEDPCKEVRLVAQEREDVLVEQRDAAVDAKEAAEAVIPPLTQQFHFAVQQKDEALVAVGKEKELVTSLSLKLEKTESSLHTWKVGGITVGVVGLTYLLIKH